MTPDYASHVILWLAGANVWLLLVIVVLAVSNARSERRWQDRHDALLRLRGDAE